MNLGINVVSDGPSATGFTLSDLVACCVPVVLLAASIVSLL